MLSAAFTAVKSIGVCYGVNGDNLPSRQEVIDLYKSNGITSMRIYYLDEEALQALRGSNIEVLLDVAKETLQSLTDYSSVNDWVNKFVVPYSDVNIKYIVVGHGIMPGDVWIPKDCESLNLIQAGVIDPNLENYGDDGMFDDEFMADTD
ncbi:hypothetical protein K1719_034796 [Acacia pycnantha]|nr:hypothetical protein K1719_034796 [Acacia pycnantha]